MNCGQRIDLPLIGWQHRVAHDGLGLRNQSRFVRIADIGDAGQTLLERGYQDGPRRGCTPEFAELAQRAVDCETGWDDAIVDILAEAERLAAAPELRSLGNWTLGQTFFHLEAAMRMSIDGTKARVPWFIRLIGKLAKERVLTKPMSPGFNLPAEASRELIAEREVSVPEALAERGRERHDGNSCSSLHLRASAVKNSYAEVAWAM